MKDELSIGVIAILIYLLVVGASMFVTVWFIVTILRFLGVDV